MKQPGQPCHRSRCRWTAHLGVLSCPGWALNARRQPLSCLRLAGRSPQPGAARHPITSLRSCPGTWKGFRELCLVTLLPARSPGPGFSNRRWRRPRTHWGSRPKRDESQHAGPIVPLPEAQTDRRHARNRPGPNPAVPEIRQTSTFSNLSSPSSDCVTLGKLVNRTVFPFLERGMRAPALGGWMHVLIEMAA